MKIWSAKNWIPITPMSFAAGWLRRGFPLEPHTMGNTPSPAVMGAGKKHHQATVQAKAEAASIDLANASDLAGETNAAWTCLDHGCWMLVVILKRKWWSHLRIVVVMAKSEHSSNNGPWQATELLISTKTRAMKKHTLTVVTAEELYFRSPNVYLPVILDLAMEHHPCIDWLASSGIHSHIESLDFPLLFSYRYDKVKISHPFGQWLPSARLLPRIHCGKWAKDLPYHSRWELTGWFTEQQNRPRTNSTSDMWVPTDLYMICI